MTRDRTAGYPNLKLQIKEGLLSSGSFARITTSTCLVKLLHHFAKDWKGMATHHPPPRMLCKEDGVLSFCYLKSLDNCVWGSCTKFRRNEEENEEGKKAFLHPSV